MTKVSFYLNEGDYSRVKDLTKLEDFTLRHPQLVWSWGTYFRLKEREYDVNLICKIPESGIVVMPAIYLAMLQKPPDNVLLICTIADSPPPLYTQINISQNPWQPSQYRNLFGLPIWRHIPHWPQPGIIPRSEGRGNKFETIAFFGHSDQLDSFLATDDFRQELEGLGMKFEIREKNLSDYSDVDAVIAIRDFSDNPFLHKPYTKLINGWLAGIPVIVGPETSFRSIQKTDLDFLSAKSKEELIQNLRKLKEDESLRRRMIENGVQRMKEFSEESIIQAWQNLLFREAQIYFEQWTRKNHIARQLFYVDLFVSRSYRSIKNKLKKQLQLG